MTKRIAKAVVLVLLLAIASALSAQPPPRPIFVVHADEFWLNLHHFLFVLGQAQGRAPDSLRQAVRDAPADAERGAQALTSAERETWAAAVTAYANGLSKRDPVEDEPHARMIGALADAGDARTLRATRIDPDARALLERAAPIYRKAWWPAHRASDQAFEAELEPLLAQHGAAIRDFLTAEYALPWPTAGYPVHLAAYSTWAGAYSTYGNLLVVASNKNSGIHGTLGLEMVFHESMHQWDDAIDATLSAAALRLGTQVSPDLSHSLVFYTAGEAVRRVVPEHVPFGDTSGRWRGRLAPLRAALDDIWKPYLDGRGTRDEALAALVARTGASAAPAPAPAQTTPRSPLFTFETDELWLNLHHFLYVLGRTEAGIPEGGRRSNQDSTAEAERGLKTLTADERKAWADAVHSYAMGLSLKSTLEQPMPATTRALADVDDAPTLSGVALDAALIATLERAAPIYRKTWWPAHLKANRAWRAATQALVDRHGAAVIDYVTRAYALPWPASGFAVHVSSYANYGSAYSSGFSHVIVVPSQSNFTAGLYGLEAIVHEAMHQWDGEMFGALRAANATVPRDLPHALIFYTSGEAVRHVEPAFVPMVDALDIWPLKLSGSSLPATRLKPLLEEIWKPWLEGRGTRDAALAVLVPRAAAVSQP